ncbi:hypothetical protein KKC22_14060 [Myxococcota bacterium]|nr:hypothetical protein [Myxococcota bacterium]
MKKIHGMGYEDDTDLKDLIIQQLKGLGPWNDRSIVEYTDGLRMALHDSGEWYPEMVKAVCELLTHPDPVIRTGAVSVIDVITDDLDASTLVDLLRDHRDLFFGVNPQGFTLPFRTDLACPLLIALGRRADVYDFDAIALLEEAARQPHGFLVADDLQRLKR